MKEVSHKSSDKMLSVARFFMGKKDLLMKNSPFSKTAADCGIIMSHFYLEAEVIVAV